MKISEAAKWVCLGMLIGGIINLLGVALAIYTN